MKMLAKIRPRIEQKNAAFQSDIAGCHGFSIANAGTSNVTFKFVSDGGEISLKPDESINFDSVADVPFEKDVIDGSFSPAEDVAEADRVDLVRIVKYIGVYEEC